MRKKGKPTAKPQEWGEWEDHSWKLFTQHQAALINRATNPDITKAYALTSRLYSVQVSEEESAWGTITHLWIKRHNGDANSIPWHHKQRIKNELVGADRVAVEVYPTTEQLVNAADMFHLYVLPVGYELPFGLHIRRADRGQK